MPLAFLFKELLIRAIAYTVGVHEPNLLGLTSGTNTIYAETGTNPCDNVKETFGNLCRYIAACKQMFFNTGFETLHLSSGKRITLYIKHN